MMFLPTPAGITGLIEALAPDLFRLRLERDASPPSPASDAIVERAWEIPETAAQRIGHRYCLATECGVFSWDRRGAWQSDDWSCIHIG